MDFQLLNTGKNWVVIDLGVRILYCSKFLDFHGSTYQFYIPWWWSVCLEWLFFKKKKKSFSVFWILNFTLNYLIKHFGDFEKYFHWHKTHFIFSKSNLKLTLTPFFCQHSQESEHSDSFLVTTSFCIALISCILPNQLSTYPKKFVTMMVSRLWSTPILRPSVPPMIVYQ